MNGLGVPARDCRLPWSHLSWPVLLAASSRVRRTLWLVLALPPLVGGLAAAAEPPAARVGRAAGLLAVRAESAEPWRVLSQGDTLPGDSLLRSAAAGPCLVHLPGGTLHVSPDAHLRLGTSKRLALLESGRIFLQTAKGKTWSATAGGLHASLKGQTAVELSVAPAARVFVHVGRGSCTVRAGKDKPRAVAAGTTIAWDGAKKKLTSKPPTAAERKRIGAWTGLDRPGQGLGQLLVKDAQSGTTTRLDIARYHVNVVLQPPVALVQIDQSFYNPYDRQEEGTFVFNLPRGASVSRFAMYVTPTQLVEGELIERKRARNIYQSIVSRRRDPAILEQIGDNLFRMRVFPIFARDTKRILLDFTLPLRADQGICRFQLPLFSDLKPIWDFRLSGTILGPTRLESLASRSHPSLTFKRQDEGAVTFEFQQQNYQQQYCFSHLVYLLLVFFHNRSVVN